MADGEAKTAADQELFWLLCVQVLEGMLEGASRLRPVLRVMGNLLATRCDSELLDRFCRELNVPLSLLYLAKQILESGSTKQVSVGPWRNLGSFQPCRVLVLRRPWYPAGAASQDQCLFQAPLRRGRSWRGRIPPQWCWDGQQTIPTCCFFLDPAAALVYHGADRPPHGDHSLFQQ